MSIRARDPRTGDMVRVDNGNMPVASASQLGGVKVGNTLRIDSGVLNVRDAFLSGRINNWNNFEVNDNYVDISAYSQYNMNTSKKLLVLNLNLTANKTIPAWTAFCKINGILISGEYFPISIKNGDPTQLFYLTADYQNHCTQIISLNNAIQQEDIIACNVFTMLQD